jgi:hypothetical protein
MAADAIYDDDLTEALCSFVLDFLVLRAKKVQAACSMPFHNASQPAPALPLVLLAAQRRVCFTLPHQTVCAPAMDFFFRCLESVRRDGFRLQAELQDATAVPSLLSDPLDPHLILVQLTLEPTVSDNNGSSSSR